MIGLLRQNYLGLSSARNSARERVQRKIPGAMKGAITIAAIRRMVWTPGRSSIDSEPDHHSTATSRRGTKLRLEALTSASTSS